MTAVIQAPEPQRDGGGVPVMTEAAARLASGRVMLADDPCFSGCRLSEILAAAGFHVSPRSPGEAAPEWAASWTELPDLVIVSLVAEEPRDLEKLRELRAVPRLRRVPILVVTPFREIGLDLQALRAHGVVGVVDDRARAGDVLHRVEHTIRPVGRRRSFERANCFFPVQVAREGLVHSEFALDLSAGGMRLTSAEWLEQNTDFSLRFALPMIAEDVIETRARLIHVSGKKNSWARYEIGVFFYPMSPRYQEIIRLEVDRLLTD
jgi:CheY-like chemotaxis protein